MIWEQKHVKIYSTYGNIIYDGIIIEHDASGILLKNTGVNPNSYEYLPFTAIAELRFLDDLAK